MTRLDQRLLDHGLSVPVAVLAQVFADHYRGEPAASRCPTCGHAFPDNDTTGDCPTLTVVRPLLLARYHENHHALAVFLTGDQTANLRRPAKAARTRHTRRTQQAPALFDLPAPRTSVEKGHQL